MPKWPSRLLGGSRTTSNKRRRTATSPTAACTGALQMKLWTTSRPALLSVVAAAFLAACGGGGSSPQEPQGALLASQDSLGNPQSASIAPATQAAVDTDGKKVARSSPAKVTNNVWIVQLSEPPV